MRTCKTVFCLLLMSTLVGCASSVQDYEWEAIESLCVGHGGARSADDFACLNGRCRDGKYVTCEEARLAATK